MKSIPVIPKKRGRPATGKDPMASFRCPDDVMAAIEAFASEEPDNPPRSEAIRRLIREALEKLGYMEP